MSTALEDLVVQKTLRLPKPDGPVGDGAVAARQFDAVLMSAGFKLSGEAMAHLSGLSEGTVIDTAVRVLPVVRQMVGDHVQHNVYFRDFPANVPDTLEFWASLLAEALLDPVAAAAVATTPPVGGLNLLALPSYGRYLHTYEEMLAAHADLIPSAGDQVTVLHLGGTVEDEVQALYVALAGSTVPLGETDLGILQELAGHCLHGAQPEMIPIRENRAVINEVRIRHGVPLLVDTVTDVLRLACALAGGDVTLQKPTRFVSLPRPLRRGLLAALDMVVSASPAKLGDVNAHAEVWKRLGERLHPHEYPQWPDAARVFAVARGEEKAPSLAARVEAALAGGDVPAAADLLRSAPGVLVRSVDRLLRAAMPGDSAAIVSAFEAAAGPASGRVLLSLREHLSNRTGVGVGWRMFANRKGRAQTVVDTRRPLDVVTVGRLCAVIDAEISRRLPEVDRLVVDPDVLDVALPLTGTAVPGGFGVLPRGSISPVRGDLLRFFVYWRETERRTDYDLSALLLADGYKHPEWVSYTALTRLGMVHSGDITSAPDGASEFIDCDLTRVKCRYVVPQVNIYTGEGFEETAESFFGFMTRDAAQNGAPFEPATVRMKSDLRGAGRVALPMVFVRSDNGSWTARWMHLHLRGHASFNQVEGNRLSTSTLMRGIVERDYLRVRYLVDLWAAKGAHVTAGGAESLTGVPVTFVGLQRPEKVPDGSRVYTLENFRDLVPR